MVETASPATASTSQDAEITSALGARSVVLVGMMGAGKSTIGRRLSARLRLPFLDADTEIEAAAGMSIPDIFEAHGENVGQSKISCGLRLPPSFFKRRR